MIKDIGSVRHYPQYVSRERVHNVMELLSNCEMRVYSNEWKNADLKSEYGFTFAFRKRYEEN